MAQMRPWWQPSLGDLNDVLKERAAQDKASGVLHSIASERLPSSEQPNREAHQSGASCVRRTQARLRLLHKDDPKSRSPYFSLPSRLLLNLANKGNNTTSHHFICTLLCMLTKAFLPAEQLPDVPPPEFMVYNTRTLSVFSYGDPLHLVASWSRMTVIGVGEAGSSHIEPIALASARSTEEGASMQPGFAYNGIWSSLGIRGAPRQLKPFRNAHQ